ncbi:hypothetical protein HAX54_016031 [Datura stramonium]|uniref:Protein kinase domain-containing protein n=1 Tax=Datura stramonium TaxID=4076 RepID=A0ABS8RZJ1_DATST|nr:hypothetical protein [Datura stramonium]
MAGAFGGGALSMAIIIANMYLQVTWIRLNNHQLDKCQSTLEDLPDSINFEDILRATEGWSDKYVIGKRHGTDSSPIIYRDLKSDNVMLDSAMEPKIGDFGIAKIVSDSDENSNKFHNSWTLGYIAPENAYSVQLTEKSDVYSYGVLLLELFCRKMPVDPCFEEGLDIVSWSFGLHSLKILFTFLAREAVFRGLSTIAPLIQNPPHTNGKGVTCYSNSTHIESLNFTDFLLSGTLDKAFPNLCRLPRLVSIDLTGNHFTGGIPTMLTNCKANLARLYSTTTDFQDPSHQRFSNQASLKLTSNNQLNGNSFHLRIFPDLPSSCSLSELYIYQNNFSGSLPITLGNCHNLTAFDASSANLEGVISPKNLNNLLLHNNMLSGSLPAEFGNCTSLVEISLVSNFISGEIPSELCNLQNLATVKAFNNQIQGPIPECIGRMSGVEELGECSGDIEKNENISYLNVRGNMLAGRIPAAFAYWTKLSTIDLSENMFSGPIPAEFGKLQNLEEFERNCIIFSIDKAYPGQQTLVPFQTLLSSSQKLVKLQLGDNMLEGPIPCSLSKLRQPNFALNLSMNNFSGHIPRCLSNLDNLEILDISSNNLSGKIPISWENYYAHPGSAQGNPGLCLSGMEAVIVAAIYLLVTDPAISLLNKHRLVKCQSGIEDLPDHIIFEDIVHATENGAKYVIGRGKHGTVYKMESVKSKSLAVKKVDLALESIQQK